MRIIERAVELTKMCVKEHLDGEMFNCELEAHQFVITGLMYGEAVAFTGSVGGRFLPPDGGDAIQFTPEYAEIDAQGRAVVTLPDNCYSVPGAFGMVITHTDGDHSTVIYAATGFNGIGETPEIVDPGNVINVDAIEAKIQEMDQAVNDCIAAADAALAVAGDVAVAGTGTETLTLTNYDLINCTVSASATLTVSGTTYQSRKIVRNLMWDSIRITANSTGATYATFVTSAFPSTITSGADISGALATGETGRHEIATNTTAEFDIPADTAYIIVTVKSTSNRTPSAVVVSTAVYNDLASYMNTVDTKMIVGDRAINTAGLLVAPYDDLNTLPRGTVVTYIGQIPSNVPSDLTGTSFTALTYNYTNITSGGSVQLVCDSNGNAWIRMKYSLSLWSAFRKITYNALPIPALSTFDNIGIIGDSWSSGSVYTAQSTYAHHSKLRWGYIASKKYGFTPAFFTSPGASTKTWLTRDAGLPAMEAASAQDLYICCLGINDHAQGLAIGVAADMDDETSTTFYGSYGQIIRAIKSKAQYAKIAIALIPKYNDTVNVSSYNTAIRAIASHFGVGLLDTEADDFFTGDVFAADRQYNHLTAVGYSAMADAINAMLGKSFANQHDYWKYSMINI